MNPAKRGCQPPRRSSWGGICCSHKQRQHAFFWMGARIVVVRVPSVIPSGMIKEDGKGGKPPCHVPKRGKSRRRTHRKGTRTSRVGRPTVKKRLSGVDHPASFSFRPGVGTSAGTQSKARTRFVNWVDRSVNRIQTRLLAEVDMGAWHKWETMDFHPTLVPWLRYDRVLRFYRHPDRVSGKLVERACFRQRRRAHEMKMELVRRLTEVKGRPPPPLYVENALAVKSRTWKSAGVPLPSEGSLRTFEEDRTDGQVLRILEEEEEVKRCAWCGRHCVARAVTPSSQVKCPKNTGCRVWETRQAQTRRRKPKGPSRK